MERKKKRIVRTTTIKEIEESREVGFILSKWTS